jgi:hypothetical protein
MVVIGTMGSVPGPATLPQSVPAPVRRWQSVWNSGARVQLLRAVLAEDRTFAQLLEACDGLGRATAWNAVTYLIECGYVTEDAAPHTAQRRPRTTVFHAERTTVNADLVAVVAWLAGGQL